MNKDAEGWKVWKGGERGGKAEAFQKIKQFLWIIPVNAGNRFRKTGIFPKSQTLWKKWENFVDKCLSWEYNPVLLLTEK
ncbi:MAG: hypothetical protein SOW84_04700 [Candidatus Faecousia sp.]|nr:hypothetical protein [Candidatus Faecousia sp.]